MTPSFKAKWLVWPALVVAIALVSALGSQPAHAQPANQMAANAPAAAQPLNTNFDVMVATTSVTDDFEVIQAKLDWLNTQLAYVSSTPLQGPPSGVFTSGCSAPTHPVGVPPAGHDNLYTGTCSTTPPAQTFFVGNVWDVKMKCLAEGTFTITMVPKAPAPAGDNTFGTATFNPGGIAITTGVTNGTVTCEKQADLSLDKVVDNATPIAGDTITYTVTVTNTAAAGSGNDAANVVVTDNLPAGVTYVSDTGGCSGAPNLSCPLGTINAGASSSFNIVATVNDDQANKKITNSASLTTDTSQGANTAPDSDSVDVNVHNTNVTVVKTPDSGTTRVVTSSPGRSW